MKKLITLVGTSLFRNYSEIHERAKIIGREWKKIKDGKGRNRNIDTWEEFSEDIERIRKPVLGWAKNNYDSSAEIKSILSIQREVKDDLEIYVIIL
jgi:hypothetical protein